MWRYSNGSGARLHARLIHGLARAVAVCRLCGRPGASLCHDCRRLLPWNRAQCPICTLPLVGSPGPCGGCQRRPPPFAAGFAVWRYEEPLDRLLPGIKYRHRFDDARLLGAWMADRLPDALLAGLSVVIPVPLHPRRLAERGFNQALELARPVAARFRLSLRPDLAWRVRDTPPQVGLGAAERRRNLREGFGAPAALPQRVLLVDDVMTTGATLEALARRLLRSGVEEVRILVAARAEPPG